MRLQLDTIRKFKQIDFIRFGRQNLARKKKHNTQREYHHATTNWYNQWIAIERNTGKKKKKRNSVFRWVSFELVSFEMQLSEANGTVAAQRERTEKKSTHLYTPDEEVECKRTGFLMKRICNEWTFSRSNSSNNRNSTENEKKIKCAEKKFPNLN